MGDFYFSNLLFCCVMSALLTFGGIMAYLTQNGTVDFISNNRDKLPDCQKDLPRSQNCVLIAVPQLVLDASKESKEK